MVMCNHTVGEATLGLQWHVLGMFLPSFFTGSLIARFGVEQNSSCRRLCAADGERGGRLMSGITIAHFWTGLVLLGLGWNFSFIGATTMVTACHRPNERNRVQSFNDFLVFGAMAIGSFSSGTMLEAYGWATVNEVVIPGRADGWLRCWLWGTSCKGALRQARRGQGGLHPRWWAAPGTIGRKA